MLLDFARAELREAVGHAARDGLGAVHLGVRTDEKNLAGESNSCGVHAEGNGAASHEWGAVRSKVLGLGMAARAVQGARNLMRGLVRADAGTERVNGRRVAVRVLLCRGVAHVAC